MRENGNKIKITLFGYLVLLYLLCYFLLYTYSLGFIEFIFPWYVIIYVGFMVGFVMLYYKLKNLLDDKLNKIIVVGFTFLPIIMVTSMFLDPMTYGNVAGASLSLDDLIRYVMFVPWSIFMNIEVATHYVRIPSIFFGAIVALLIYVKRRDVLEKVPVIILALIPFLIIYLEYVETFFDSGH